MLDNEQNTEQGTFEQDPKRIDELIKQWRKCYPGATFAIAIEQSKGPLISALLKYDDLVIYPINPAALASYRKAFAHGGGKNDPVDAQLLCQYLQHYLAQLRPLRQDDPLTRELATLAEDRRRLVDGRTAQCNELKAVLKQYFPEVLKLKAAKMYVRFLLRFLAKYPTLEAAQQAGADELRKFFYGVGAKRKVEDRVNLLIGATPLSNDDVLNRNSARRAIALSRLIETTTSKLICTTARSSNWYGSTLTIGSLRHYQVRRTKPRRG